MSSGPTVDFYFSFSLYLFIIYAYSRFLIKVVEKVFTAVLPLHLGERLAGSACPSVVMCASVTAPYFSSTGFGADSQFLFTFTPGTVLMEAENDV